MTIESFRMQLSCFARVQLLPIAVVLNQKKVICSFLSTYYAEIIKKYYYRVISINN